MYVDLIDGFICLIQAIFKKTKILNVVGVLWLLNIVTK